MIIFSLFGHGCYIESVGDEFGMVDVFFAEVVVALGWFIVFIGHEELVEDVHCRFEVSELE